MDRNNTKQTSVVENQHGECSDAVVEIKIKTLDSQVYTLKVNKQVPIPALKEQIATVTGVLSEQQRLICRGKVLKDDQLLSAYHVEDGHTLHLVVRQPFQHSSSARGPDPSGTSRRGAQVAHTVLLGSSNIPDQLDAGVPDLSRVVSTILGTVGSSNFVPLTSSIENRSAMFHSGFPNQGQPRPSVRGQDGSSQGGSRGDPNQIESDMFIDMQTDSGHAMFRIPSPSLPRSLPQPHSIPDSLTTMSQYINRMRNEFRSGGTNNQPEIGGIRPTASEAFGNYSGSVTGGLPSPVALADVLRATQQLLTQQIGTSFNQLATQLESDASITDVVARTEIQSAAIQNGVMMQNLGALLLELGRATMTLRMGRSSAESVVNAGPAVFISTSGPNPLMVQPLPFMPGSSFGSIPTGVPNQGTREAGRTMPAVFSTPQHMNVEQPEDGRTHLGGERNAGTHVRSERRSMPLLFGDGSAARVVPLRTVIAALPAALSTRVPTEASAGGPETVPLPSFQDQTQTQSSMQSGREHSLHQEEPQLSNFLSAAPQTPAQESGQEHSNLRSYVIEVATQNFSVVNGTANDGTSNNENSSSTQLPDVLGWVLNSMLPGDHVGVGRRVTLDLISEPQSTSRANTSRESAEQINAAAPGEGNNVQQSLENSPVRSGPLHTLNQVVSESDNNHHRMLDSSGMFQPVVSSVSHVSNMGSEDLASHSATEVDPSVLQFDGHSSQQVAGSEQGISDEQHHSSQETPMEIERSKEDNMDEAVENYSSFEGSPPSKRQKIQ
eukprot:TRINITY_DN72_c0_g1_i1.p1 TRINITY_DN72_c0_g1~~TRINITY_DN72_c0_g1_i1.p1  ORF type:complete len:779 (-),score=166.62 TRINITY_DN72_c0_g1_i1:677-3013(-)